MRKKLLKISGRVLLGFAAFVLLYFGAAWLLSRIGVKREEGAAEEVTIYIKTNGVHTDIVMPVRHPARDWSKTLPVSNTKAHDTAAAKFISMGWGDKGFYLETPTWADLTARTAFRAAFWLGSAAVHATYYRELQEGKDCKSMRISNEQYARLIRYIDNSFAPDAAGAPVFIRTDAVYGGADAFYEAKGKYSLFRTCNVWANGALKACGQKAAVWAPFDWGIFYQYR